MVSTENIILIIFFPQMYYSFTHCCKIFLLYTYQWNPHYTDHAFFSALYSSLGHPNRTSVSTSPAVLASNVAWCQSNVTWSLGYILDVISVCCCLHSQFGILKGTEVCNERIQSDSLVLFSLLAICWITLEAAPLVRSDSSQTSRTIQACNIAHCIIGPIPFYYYCV